MKYWDFIISLFNKIYLDEMQRIKELPVKLN